VGDGGNSRGAGLPHCGRRISHRTRPRKTSGGGVAVARKITKLFTRVLQCCVCWAGVPCCRGVAGLIATLAENGTLRLLYLGTDPSLGRVASGIPRNAPLPAFSFASHVQHSCASTHAHTPLLAFTPRRPSFSSCFAHVPSSSRRRPLDGKEPDYAAMDEETRRLRQRIKEAMASRSSHLPSLLASPARPPYPRPAAHRDVFKRPDTPIDSHAHAHLRTCMRVWSTRRHTRGATRRAYHTRAGTRRHRSATSLPLRNAPSSFGGGRTRSPRAHA